MSKNLIIIIVILIIIGAVFYFQRGNNAPASVPAEETQEESQTTDSKEQPQAESEVDAEVEVKPTETETTETKPTENIVTYSNSGYSPSIITVKVGQTVIFKNDSSRGMWTASAVHPTHRVYPSSDIKKCGSESAGTIFDSCGEIFSGSSWSFQFNEAGTWRFHNHLNPSQTGTVVVE